MIFSSTIFLLWFLPVILILYFAVQRKYRNLVLLLGSLLFYAWGEPKYVLLMLISIMVNYVFAWIVVSCKEKNRRVSQILLGTDMVINLSMLFYFKYLDFTIFNINKLSGVNIPEQHILLPIGISFFTFQAMSYVIDCYRGDGEVQKNPVNVALYISLFPQLIAGPIVRYETISDQLKNRKETIPLFASGIGRFLIGMGKKCLLANTAAYLADTAFAEIGSLSVVTAWLGVAGYGFQIYFDFSGYSDMAIGLGRMFGFEFLENFRYPYISKSITEFWRRWHISLGTWFRDYVYIPLGGNRKGIRRQYLNIGIVWLLTGIWHGANWTFICWGIYYGIFLMIEKKFLYKYLDKSRVAGHLYTLFLVTLGWAFFRADNIHMTMDYMKKLFGIGTGFFAADHVFYQMIDNRVYLLIAMIVITPAVPKLVEKMKLSEPALWKDIVIFGSYILLGILVLTNVLSNSYNPFIYFNF